MDRFESMRVFVLIADCGSLARAAQASGMSPSMAGNHLRSLEHHLGLQLLVRTTRRQQLTAFGEDYLARCREILALVDDTDLQAASQRLAPAGPLRVSAPLSFGSYGLTPALGDYLKQYPQVSVEMDLTDRVVDLVEERVDVSVRIGTLSDSSLVARPLKPYRVVCCASPAYLAEHGEPADLDALGGHQCLGFDPLAMAQWREQWRLPAAAAPSGRLRINHGQALRQAALQGLGIILQPDFLVAADVQAGHLQRLFPGRELRRPLGVVYPQARYRSPAVRSFVEFLLARFG